MTNQYIQAMLLTMVVAGFSTDSECLESIHGKMPCKKTNQTLYVQAGDSLVLNCTCFDKTNGQWTGPNKHSSLNSKAGDMIPYTHGTDLNKNLNKSKYRVSGGYDEEKCYLVITNFLSDDDGEYVCQYMTPFTVYIHVYNIVATNMERPVKTIVSIELMFPIFVIIIACVVVTVVLLWRRKDKSEHIPSWIENVENDPQDDSIENRLNQSSEFLERHNVRGQHRVYRNEAFSSSRMHEDEQYRGLNATVTANETWHGFRETVSQGACARINEMNMNYAEVTFDFKPSTPRFIIHGNDERTIYSEIDHAIRAEPLPSSSSESEDD